MPVPPVVKQVTRTTSSSSGSARCVCKLTNSVLSVAAEEIKLHYRMLEDKRITVLVNQ
jgi:hypothetical protein